jgi:CRISPR-associated protein Cmr2
MSADWQLKLIAWLHDPPDKVLGLDGHEGRALTWLEQLIDPAGFQQVFGTDAAQLQTRNQRGATLADVDAWQQVKKADQVASAMDRAAFPGGLRFRWTRPSQPNPNWSVIEPSVRHPLSGREWRLGTTSDAGIVQAIDATVQDVLHRATDTKTRYLLLWRQMQYLLRNQTTSSVGAKWHLLPADTRIVDHTLWEHLGVTAAVAGALPQPALLVFSLGPVQDFIATARRTQDLWMGSYILSYLAWQGMKVIANEFGPDVMLYPSLRGQPLVDHWLRAECQLPVDEPSDEERSRATLPNKFVALLPADQAEDTAKRVTQRVKDAWSELATAVAKWLRNDVQILTDELWQKLWHDHIRQIPECYWSIHRWCDTSQFTASKDEAEAAVNEYREYLAPPPDNEFDRIYDAFCQTAPSLVNIGTVYSRLHELAQHGFEARKMLRDFEPAEEQGAKCTMCGNRAALRTKNKNPKEFWSDLGTILHDRQDLGLFVAIKPEGRERLCGICTVKRFVQRAHLQKRNVLDLRGGFPSTSSIAAASFKAKVIENLNEVQLANALGDHLSVLRNIRFYRFAVPTAFRMSPRLARLTKQLPSKVQRLAIKFLCYDGDAFYEETFTVERLHKDYGLKVVEQQADVARRSLRQLLAVCRELDIAPPAKYFAILKLDGDRIRNWLSGVNAPLFADTLHHEVSDVLRDRNWDEWERLANQREAAGNSATAEILWQGWQAFLQGKRFLSPSLHAALSRALANFALYLAPLVVEYRYCGRIVYAGGDDLLALLPVNQALPAARELRALFSGEAEITNSDEVEVRFGNQSLSGFVNFNGEPLMTMGPKATASIGICIAHHLSPLDRALEATRRAEDSAKEDYGRRDAQGRRDPHGSNALCVNFLRRSGEEKRVGAQWYYKRSEYGKVELTRDTAALLDELQDAFVDKRLSMQFAHAVADQARILAGSSQAPIPLPAQEAALRRILKRQRGSALNSEEGEVQAGALAPQLARLAQALQQHCSSDDPALDKPQPGMVQLADWLLLTRFLSQGGGE